MVKRKHSLYKLFFVGHGLSIAEDLSTLTTRVKITLAEFNLNPGVRYYSNVQAYTLSGLDETVASDGFVIDNDKPTTGVVLDGRSKIQIPIGRFNSTKLSLVLTTLGKKPFENILGPAFSPCPTMFSTFPKTNLKF